MIRLGGGIARIERGGGGDARLRRAGAVLPRRALLRPRRPRVRTVIAAVVLVALLVAGWSWLRDSSLVSVRTVEVTGITGGQADEVRAALDEAGRSMTTLHVREAALRTAVMPFSIVKRIEVTTDFPRTLRVHVVTNVAVGAVVIDGRAIPVTADGTLLRDVTPRTGLATVPLSATPGGDRVTEPAALEAVAALGAAPAALRAHVQKVETTSAHGLAVQLSNGPVVWFGDDSRLVAKWAATAAVLADPQSAGASYVNVTAPGRPAVGGLPGGAPATGSSDVPALPEGSGTTDPSASAPNATGGESTDATASQAP